MPQAKEEQMKEQGQAYLVVEKLEFILAELDDLKLVRPAIKVSHALDCLRDEKPSMRKPRRKMD